MAASGAVAFQFERKGVVPVKKGPSEDQVMELALDAGAEEWSVTARGASRSAPTRIGDPGAQGARGQARRRRSAHRVSAEEHGPGPGRDG